MNLSQEEEEEEDSRKMKKKKKSHYLPQVINPDAEFSKVETEEEHGRQNGIPAKEEVNEVMIIKTEEIFIDETQEQEQEEEEHELMMSADELHRKCEEFIKKMREEIKVEFHQPIRI